MMCGFRVGSIILALLIVGIWGPFTRGDSVTEELSVAASSPAEIYIDSDANFTEENGVSGGSGTEEDPFIMDGISFNTTRDGIRI